MNHDYKFAAAAVGPESPSQGLGPAAGKAGRVQGRVSLSLIRSLVKKIGYSFEPASTPSWMP